MCPKKKYRLVPVEYIPERAEDILVGSFAISKEDEQTFLINREMKLIEKKLEETTGSFISKNYSHLFKLFVEDLETGEIIATEENLGWFVEDEEFYPINSEHINAIMNNEGIFEIEMYEEHYSYINMNGIHEGEGTETQSGVTLKPLFLENKLVICI